MCGLSLPWAAPVADFAARHALSALGLGLGQRGLGQRGTPSPPYPNPLRVRHALSAAATAELESLFAASQAEALLFGESHVPKLQQMWGIEVRCE